MIEELANLLDDFPGPANQTHCFLHILNLVVKSIIQQFDLPKSKKTSEVGDEDDPMLDAATMELLKLAGDLDLDKEITVSDGDGDDSVEDDDEEGWIDEHDEMTDAELGELAISVQPVRLLLTKVRNKLHNISLFNSPSQLRKVAFAIKNSTTIMLPQWFAILNDLKLAKRMIPRDVATRWNSTFDMLDFAVEHIAAINTITGDCDMKLRQYELSEDEWNIARQLRDVLKV